MADVSLKQFEVNGLNCKLNVDDYKKSEVFNANVYLNGVNSSKSITLEQAIQAAADAGLKGICRMITYKCLSGVCLAAFDGSYLTDWDNVNKWKVIDFNDLFTNTICNINGINNDHIQYELEDAIKAVPLQDRSIQKFIVYNSYNNERRLAFFSGAHADWEDMNFWYDISLNKLFHPNDKNTVPVSNILDSMFETTNNLFNNANPIFIHNVNYMKSQNVFIPQAYDKGFVVSVEINGKTGENYSYIMIDESYDGYICRMVASNVIPEKDKEYLQQGVNAQSYVRGYITLENDTKYMNIFFDITNDATYDKIEELKSLIVRKLIVVNGTYAKEYIPHYNASSLLKFKNGKEDYFLQLSEDLVAEASNANFLLQSKILNVYLISNKAETLEEAISVVPDNERCQYKIIYYFDIDDGPCLAYFNSHLYISEFTNIIKWVKLPMNVIEQKLYTDNLVSLDNFYKNIYEQSENLYNKFNCMDVYGFTVLTSQHTYRLNGDISELKFRNYSFILEINGEAGDIYSVKIFGDKKFDDLAFYSGFVLVQNDLISETTVWSVCSEIKNSMMSTNITLTENCKYLVLNFVSYDISHSLTEYTESIQYIKDNLVVVKSLEMPADYIPYYKNNYDTSNYVNINQGSANVGKVMCVDADGNLVPTDIEKTGSDTLGSIKDVIYRTVHIGIDVLDGITASGNNWVVGDDNVYTHTTSDMMDELVYEYDTINGQKYIVDVNLGSNKESSVWIAVGDSYNADVYNGGNQAYIGIVGNGGKIKVIASKYDSSVKLKCYVVDENSENTIQLQVKNVYSDVYTRPNIGDWWNVSLGDAMRNNINGTRNIAIGNAALKNLESGNRNVGVGTFAMCYMKYGENNIAIGSDSLWFCDTAMNTISIGKASCGYMDLSNTYDRVVSVGNGALGGAKGNIEECVAIGNSAHGGYNVSNPKYNVCVGAMSGFYAHLNNVNVGYRSGYYNKGDDNVCIGYNVGETYVNFNNSILIGSNAKVVSPESTPSASNIQSFENVIAIGYNVIATASNQIVIGKDTHTEVMIAGKKIIFNDDKTISWE